MAESKTPERLVRASRAFFGWMPGGLAIVCVVASAFFTTLTGGSGVTIVAIGGLLYPALRKQRLPGQLLARPRRPPAARSACSCRRRCRSSSTRSSPASTSTPRSRPGSSRASSSWSLLGIYARVHRHQGEDPALDARPQGDGRGAVALQVGARRPGGHPRRPRHRPHRRSTRAPAITALYTLVIEVFVYKDLDLKKDLRASRKAVDGRSPARSSSSSRWRTRS